MAEGERREHVRMQTSCLRDCVLCENSRAWSRLQLPDSREGGTRRKKALVTGRRA